ncbi:MAG: hypothetical protein KF895_02770 [Parvibaculum sp.]|nr:hypothetical protein [Parvibaculum sp.]
MSEPDDDLIHMLGFAIRQRKRDLADLGKKHPLDDGAGARVAKAVLEHIRLCGFDIVRVKPPRQNLPPSAARRAGKSTD